MRNLELEEIHLEGYQAKKATVKVPKFYMENIRGEYVLTEVREVRIEQTGRNFYADETQL